jgi:glutamine---fructose-6-phosphate transaminase (isomerizing)
VLKLGIVNAVGSTISRITDAGVYTHAGPELSVASTKAFIAQVSVLTEIALHLSEGRTPLYKPLIDELLKLPKKAEEILAQAPKIKKLAEKYAGYKDFLYIGRNYEYPTALEGALKLKEISYIHAEGFAAGEMKHGPLAMIEENSQLLPSPPTHLCSRNLCPTSRKSKPEKAQLSLLPTKATNRSPSSQTTSSLSQNQRATPANS